MTAVKPTPSSCQMWWPMDEAVSSGTRYDSTSGSYDLSDVNTVAYSTTAKQGNSASLISTSSEALYRSDGAEFNFLEGSSSWTITGWVRPGSLGSSHRRILCKYSTSSKQILIYRHYASPSYVAAYVYNSSGASAYSTTTDVDLSVSTWAFIAIRYDGATDKVQLTVDTTHYPESAALSGGINTGTASFRFGNYDGAGTGYFYGLYDEWNAWNTRLTDDNLEWMYNSGSGQTWNNLNVTTLSATVQNIDVVPVSGGITPGAVSLSTVAQNIDIVPVNATLMYDQSLVTTVQNISIVAPNAGLVSDQSLLASVQNISIVPMSGGVSASISLETSAQNIDIVSLLGDIDASAIITTAAGTINIVPVTASVLAGGVSLLTVAQAIEVIMTGGGWAPITLLYSVVDDVVYFSAVNDVRYLTDVEDN